jgi:broad specificity phosphatase PhoE
MIQEKNIFLIRHGETEWNTQIRLQGNQDSPLSRNELKRVKGVGGT